MKNFLLIILSILCFVSYGQIEIRYSIRAFVDASSVRIMGQEEITIINIGNSPIQEIPIEVWGNAYQPKSSFLAKEFLEDQKVQMLYADNEELGLVDSLNFSVRLLGNKIVDQGFSITADEAQEIYLIHLDSPLNKGDSLIIETPFRVKLPKAEYNGFGYNTNSLRLSKWFPRISGYTDSSFYPVYNSRERYAYNNSARIKVDISIDQSVQLLASDEYQLSKSDGFNHYQFDLQNSSDLLLYLTPQMFSFEIPKTNTGSTLVNLYYHSDFPTINFIDAFKNIFNFYHSELGLDPPSKLNILILNKKKSLESSGNLIIVEKKNNSDDIEAQIVEELVKICFTEKVNVNSAQYPWLVNGMSHYYKTLYLRTFYPEKKYLGWFAKSTLGKFFDADEYAYEYRNIFLYHYMARQGLDQPISDSAASFPTLNYQAVINGKTSLYIDYLRNYSGDKDFKRSMQKFTGDFQNKNANPEDLLNSFKFYSNKNLDWFYDELYSTANKYDYKIRKSENCSYVHVATVKNKGKVKSPFSLTGIKDEKPVLTEWYDGFEGTKTVQMHVEDYDEVLINYNHRFPEFNQRNNSIKTKGLFKKSKPLRLQFYTSLENPEKTQLFWVPSLKYNAYDLFSIGATFYNSTLVRRPFEYKITPEFSTGTAELVGSGSIKYNWTFPERKIRQVSLGLYGRRYHYAPETAYTRLSPSLNFYLRKPNPRSEILRTIKLRAVVMDKELPPGFDGSSGALEFASYQVFNAQYIRENVSVLRPSRVTISAELSEPFSKIQMEYLQRFRLSKNHLLGLRLFAGTFIHNNSTNPNGLDFYSFGVSGTQDYLFDYYFIGRSDQSGIWSNQMFVTDGGFKSETNDFTSNSIFALNTQIPIWRYFQLFGDVAYIQRDKQNIVWDYGVSLVIVPDFLEIHFPVQNNQAIFINQTNYIQHVRYVLNLDPEKIINRLRRGFY